LISESVALRHKMTGEGNRRALAAALYNLATVLNEVNTSDAEAALREALVIRQELLDKDDPDLLATQAALAQGDEAERILRRSLTALEAHPGGQDLYLAGILNHLGLGLRNRGELVEAETLLRRALDLRRKLYPQGHADLAQSLSNLGRVL